MLGIRSKLTLPTLLAGVILLALVRFGLAPAWEAVSLEEELKDQQNILSAMSPEISRNILSGDYAALISSLDQNLEQHRGYWVSFRLNLEDGTQAYPLSAAEPAPTAKDDLHEIVWQVAFEERTLATITLTVDWSVKWATQEKHLEQFTIYVSAILVALLLLTLIVQDVLVRRPLINLKMAVKEIASGNYVGQKADESKSDEIGQLARSFNSMAKELSLTHGNLTKALAEAKLESTRFKVIHDSITEGLIVINEEGLIRSLNPMASNIFGHKDLSGQELSISALLPDMSDFFLEEKQKLVLVPSGVSETGGKLVQGVRHNGEAFWARVSVAPIFLQNGMHYCALVRDVTDELRSEDELKDSRQQALAASQAKSDFLAKMSHEIRTPLNGMLGMAQLLQKSNLDEKQRQQLASILESGENLLVVINDILDLSKIESGSMTIESVPFDLNRIIEDIVGLFSAKCDQKGIRISASYAANLPEVFEGDPVRIRQILLNLVSNAVKFTETGGIEVRVNGTETDQGFALEFEVIDSGVGIKEEAHATLFEAFVQEDDSTTRKYGGSGLGLAIIKQLVELMGGSISLESQPGKGSNFSFCLLMPEGQLESRPESGEQSGNFGNLKLSGHILLVEDNEVNQLVAKTMIEGVGLSVEVANDGMEALEVLKRSEFDLILMDCQMPVMSGYESAQRIRSDLQLDTPIIALTADAYEDNKQRCFDAGMNDFVTKPISLTDLESKLGKWLNPAFTD